MPEVVSCPKCKRQMQVSDELFGKQVRCPVCKEIFDTIPTIVPDGEAPMVKAAPEEPFAWDELKEEEDEESDDDDSDDGHRRRRRLHKRDLLPHRGAFVYWLGTYSWVILIFTGAMGLPISFILALLAWIFGANDLRAMRNGVMDRAGEGQTQSGRNIGIVMVIVQAILLLLVAVAIVVGFFYVVFGHQQRGHPPR